MEIKDHLRNAHLEFFLKAQCLLNFLLKFCHVAIKGCALKMEIALVAAPPVEGFASRTHNALLAGFFQFVGDTMQPANHRAIGIQDAAGRKIERAHQSYRLLVVMGFFRCIADGHGPQLYLVLHLGFEGHQPLFKINIFNEGVMIKPRPAAIVAAPIAGKAIIVGRPVIGVVHSCINLLQPLNKNGRDGAFNRAFQNRDHH